jgi:hypothetical protein
VRRLTLIGGWVATAVALAVWVVRTSPPQLREQLKVLQFWSLEICFALVVAASLGIARDVWRQLGRQHAVRILVLAAVAVILTVFVAPRTSRIYYDEHIYQSIGHNMGDLRRAQMCLDGRMDYGRLECSAGEYNKQPYAYPHLLSVAYRLAGVGPTAAFVVNALAMAATVAMVYFVVLVLFKDGMSATFGGLIIALTPHQLLWSATAAVEPLASLACVAAVAAIVHFVSNPSTRALVAAGVISAYAIQFRPESVLILLVVGLLVLVLAPQEAARQRFWWVGLLCFVLVSVHLAHLLAIRNENWGTTAARFSWQYVAPNFAVNGRFYAGDERFPLIYSVLAIAGLMGAGLTVQRFAMLLYFILFFGVTLLFYAGSYNYGADVRYSVMTYPPLAILAGLGAGQVARLIARWQTAEMARRMVIAGLAFQFLWYAPLVRATTEEAWAARVDVRFAEAVAADLPPHAMVLTHNPGMFHLWGVNAAQMYTVVDNPARLHFLASRYAGGVYLHWNFWCNVADPVQTDVCRKAAGMMPLTVVREHREQNQRFAFLRIDVPDAHLQGPWHDVNQR